MESQDTPLSLPQIEPEPQYGEVGPSAQDRAFSLWCVMTHGRSMLLRALQAWGFDAAARAIQESASLGALKLNLSDAYTHMNRVVLFVPLRRDLLHALNTLHAAATFAGRGDVKNTAAVVIGVFTAAESALAWRRPWQRLDWRKRRSQVIIKARQAQLAQRRAMREEAPSGPSDHEPPPGEI